MSTSTESAVLEHMESMFKAAGIRTTMSSVNREIPGGGSKLLRCLEIRQPRYAVGGITFDITVMGGNLMICGIAPHSTKSYSFMEFPLYDQKCFEDCFAVCRRIARNTDNYKTDWIV